MGLLIAIAVVFTLLLMSEVWWRKRAQPNEFSRKFVHISVGSFVAFWPYFLTRTEILLLSLAFFIVVTASKLFGIFTAIHSVQRPTWGEIFFALAVGGTLLLADSKLIFTIALLQMSLADGLAAIVGLRYGKRHRYSVFGAEKSVAGTATFFAVAVILLGVYAALTVGHPPVAALVAIAAVTTLLENGGVYGLDNILVPLTVAAALSL